MKSSILLFFLFCLMTAANSQIIINEVQSANATTIQDNFGEYEDWIEILNTGSAEFDVGGLVLKDQLDTWVIPTDEPSTLLQPGEFLLLWADDEEVEGAFHTNFKLSASNGEFLGLYETDGTTVIDSTTIPPLADDLSFGQCESDGWQIFFYATPLANNDCGTAIESLTKSEPSLVWTKGKELYFNMDHFSELQNSSVQLFDLNGREVWATKSRSLPPVVHLNSLPTGHYMFVIIHEESVFTQRIMLIE